ncbi:MAG TPA: hypothetical protein VGL53_08690 [Bryobacteraceae bacterium]|jgi:hypothetical protein
MASALEFVPKGSTHDKSKPPVPVPLIGTHWNTMNELIVFQAIINKDVDGALRAYGPLGIHPKPLDGLANATDDSGAVFNADGNNSYKWTSVVNRLAGDTRGGVTLETDLRMRDRDQHFPIVQQDGAGRGFYVSTTAASTGLGQPWEPRHYFDGSVVPYSALTPPLANRGVGLGDLGLAIRPESGQSMAFSFLDAGPGNKVGEVSGRVFDYFFPLNNQEGKPVTFLVFPGSGAAPSSDEAKYKEIIMRRLSKLSAAPNADDLTLLLAVGADLARLNAVRSTGMAAQTAGGRYQMLKTILDNWGYRPARSGPVGVPEDDPVPGDYPMRRGGGTSMSNVS